MSQDDLRLKAKSQIRFFMGLHGIAGVLEILSEICKEFGEGTSSAIPVAPFWLQASAYVDRAKDEIQDLIDQQDLVNPDEM